MPAAASSSRMKGTILYVCVLRVISSKIITTSFLPFAISRKGGIPTGDTMAALISSGVIAGASKPATLFTVTRQLSGKGNSTSLGSNHMYCGSLMMLVNFPPSNHNNYRYNHNPTISILSYSGYLLSVARAALPGLSARPPNMLSYHRKPQCNLSAPTS
ncbi:hypothetical protein ES703_111980 [subsurface metagenome]